MLKIDQNHVITTGIQSAITSANELVLKSTDTASKTDVHDSIITSIVCD
jgi:hypothetical protein